MNKMTQQITKPIVRFAPSPTGYLHIGSARTALFNWLFARRYGGTFLLRIEDTDRERSTKESIEVIFKSLDWLGLTLDAPPVFQSERAERHRAVAKSLLEKGKAYYSYLTQEELQEQREAATQAKKKFEIPCRNLDLYNNPNLVNTGRFPTIRLLMPRTGETILHDLVQGTVRINNEELDDMVLLRSDGTPTYMLSVVVDDYDMNITHVIRGDDHLTNAFRQIQLIEACGFPKPEYAHIPLIHSSDGTKLSKRKGAVGTNEYLEMGILKKAMLNYLLRLGWSHGNDEIISKSQAIEWFNLENIGRSPARLDMNKLLHLNGHYLKQADDLNIYEELQPFLEPFVDMPLSKELEKRLLKGLKGLKERSKTLKDLSQSCLFYLKAPMYGNLDDKAKKFLQPDLKGVLLGAQDALNSILVFEEEAIEVALKEETQKQEQKLSVLSQLLRVALTGRTISPGIFEIITILGKEETDSRITSFLAMFPK